VRKTLLLALLLCVPSRVWARPLDASPGTAPAESHRAAQIPEAPFWLGTPGCSAPSRGARPFPLLRTKFQLKKPTFEPEPEWKSCTVCTPCMCQNCTSCCSYQWGCLCPASCPDGSCDSQCEQGYENCYLTCV
jgi:hypothetical protein